MTEPHAAFLGRERERARLLSTLLLVLIALSFLAMILIWADQFSPSFFPAMPETILLAIVYGLSRTRYQRIAIVSTLTLVSMRIFLAMFIHNDGAHFHDLSITILLASAFLSVPATLLVAGAQIGAFLLILALNPRMPTGITLDSISSVTAIGVLAIIIAWARQHDRHELETREREARRARVEGEERASELLEALVALARLDFSHPAPIRGDDSVFDAMASGVAMFGEELQAGIEKLESANADLRRARDEAQTANRAKSAFLANMSHEIRTPLNAILGFAQLMLRDPSLSERQRQQLSTITRSGERLLGLISDLIDYSKIEAGRLAAEESNFDLRELLRDLEELFRPRFDAKGLAFLVKLSPAAACPIVGDESKLREILQHLLSNAAKFTERGGVSLRVDVKPLSSSVATAPETDGAGKSLRLIAEVEDSGPGIAPDEMDRLFKVFEQTESGQKAKSGTGLGLAICRKFTELLGGSLEAKSELGHGSTFRLELPVGAGLVGKLATIGQVAGLAPGQEAYRILVADDEEDNRDFLESLLASVGFEVRTVEDGLGAAQEFEEWKPHLILMDMRMPVMAGREAIGVIRAKEGGAAVKIIAATANAFNEDRLQAIEAGADDFIGKPFLEGALFEKLHAFLGVRYRFVEEGQCASRDERKAEAERPPNDLREAVAALPEALVCGLREAALVADIERIRELTAEIEARDAGIATELRRLAARFDYRKVIELLESGGEA